jgi:hypothetical protein
MLITFLRNNHSTSFIGRKIIFNFNNLELEKDENFTLQSTYHLFKEERNMNKENSRATLSRSQSLSKEIWKINVPNGLKCFHQRLVKSVITTFPLEAVWHYYTRFLEIHMGTNDSRRWKVWQYFSKDSYVKRAMAVNGTTAAKGQWPFGRSEKTTTSP